MARTPFRELVVFLHAVGGDATFWEPQIEAVSRAGYAMLALDLVRPAPEVSMAAFADDVAAAIERAGYTRAHLVGLSMGGVVALEVFRRHRTRVRSLVLCNCWAWNEQGPARTAWAEEQLARMSLADFSRMSLPGLFAPDTDRTMVEHAVRVESAKDPEMYLACWREMFRADFRAMLPEIDVPLLLVGGSLDPVTPTEPLLTMVRDAVPTARLVNIQGASHFSNIDRPREFNAALVSFLRSTRSASDDRLAPPDTNELPLPEGTSAERLLRLLPLRGVEIFVANSGTDFTPIIDALARLEHEGAARPRVVQVPHENTAIALAHGHTLLSGRPQAVMGHVSVGSANMGLGLINARRSRVPLLVLAGRTPWYEQGTEGVRTNFVQWGQESFDQGAMFREYTKWDYELRGPNQLETVLDRALAIAESEPKGPVYLTLPKEALCARAPASRATREARQTPTRPALPAPGALESARRWIESAQRPLVITADLGRHAGGPEALVHFATRAGAGVIEHGKRNFFNFPTEHAHHLGFDPGALVRQADLIIAVECPVPWIPALTDLEHAPPLIQIGTDPLFSDVPMRGFPSDLSLAGDPVETLRALAAMLPAARAARTAELRSAHDAIFGAAREAASRSASADKISKAYLSYALGRIFDDDVVVFNEYDLDPYLVPRRCPQSWFENSFASGLGWSLGAALGAKIAAPDKTVVVTLGDGSYMFNTPLSAHAVAAAERLPILIVVFNDAAWSTIKKSTRSSHPQGWSARTGRYALCDFPSSLAFEKVAESCGGLGLRVESPAEIEGTLRDALAHVRRFSQHVLVNVVCERDA